MDFCPGGELFYLLKNVGLMKEAHIKFYFAEILLGLEYLHSKNIIYRDLKVYGIYIYIYVAREYSNRCGGTRKSSRLWTK